MVVLKRGTTVFLTILMFSCAHYKQKQANRKLMERQLDTSNTPYWKTMMDDTLVPYASTVSAFDLYWKNKKRPIKDEINEGKDIFGGGSSNDISGNYDEVFEYKRFLQWKQKSQYKLKPDGRVMTDYELLQQWKKTKQDSI